MTTKIFHVVILLVIAMATTFSTCKKGGFGCATTVYNFKIRAQAYPNNDSMHIGDTIWIKVSAPTNLTDVTSNSIVNYSGADNLGNALSFDIFTGGSISDPGTSFAAKYFNFFLKTGSIVNNPDIDRIREYLFLEENAMFKFELAVIPKSKGTFGLAISDAVNIARKSDKCTKASFAINFENIDQHLYLYQNNRPGYQINSYERTHLYCFKVY